jgi:DNA-binding transcriptional LysR family regulator
MLFVNGADMFNTTNVDCFMRLVRTLSFSETARQMYMTQQAVSKNIVLLENALGFRLFTRSTKKVALTDEGAACYELFLRLGAMYDEKIAELRTACTQAKRSPLRVGYLDYLDISEQIIEVYARLQETMPEVRVANVRNSAEELNQYLFEGKLDLIIIYDHYFFGGRDYEKLPLFDVPTVVMASPNNYTINPSTTYADFEAEPVLINRLDNESEEAFKRRTKIYVKACGLKNSMIIPVQNRATAYCEAELGNGIVIGTEKSRTSVSSRLVKLPTGVLETVSCFWRKQNGNDLAPTYYKMIKNVCDELLEGKKVTAQG